MSTPGAARRKNGSTPATLGAAATAPGETLGRNVRAAAAAAGLSFGRGGHTTAPVRSLARAVGLAPPPRSRGRGGGSVAATLPATAPFSIDGTFPSSSSASMGFPFPPSPSAVCFDAAGGDSSPGSWDNNLHPSGGFMSYFSNQPHNSHLVGVMNQPQYNDGSSPPEVEILGNPSNENDTVRTEKRIKLSEQSAACLNSSSTWWKASLAMTWKATM